VAAPSSPTAAAWGANGWRSDALHGRATFPKAERLQRGQQFHRVYDAGRKVAGPLAVLYWLAAPGGRAIGIVTGRKLGGAVQRNRARRLLREAYRRHKHQLPADAQLVVVARRGMVGQPFARVEAEWLALCRRAGILVQS